LGTIGSGLVIGDNTIQWNNMAHASNNAEIEIFGGTPSCQILRNWVEADQTNTSQFLDQQNASAAQTLGCDYIRNQAPGSGSATLLLGTDATHQIILSNISYNQRACVTSQFYDRSVKFLNNYCSGTWGTAPTVTCSGGSTGASVTAGSTNTSGQIITSSIASTNCTLTFSTTTNPPPYAPFCSVDDGSASITPSSVSVGATSATTMVIDFASATSKTFNYVCPQ
jgi:hypothetical protein